MVCAVHTRYMCQNHIRHMAQNMENASTVENSVAVFSSVLRPPPPTPFVPLSSAILAACLPAGLTPPTRATPPTASSRGTLLNPVVKPCPRCHAGLHVSATVSAHASHSHARKLKKYL